MSCAASGATCRTTTSPASPIRSSAWQPPTKSHTVCRSPSRSLRWVFTGKGMLTYSPSLVAASVKVLETRRRPTCRSRSRPAVSRAARSANWRRSPGLSAGAWQMRPLSRGYVEAKSNQPGDMPAINPRYLSDETDRRAIIGGLRFARRLFDAPRCSQFVGEETLPGRDIQTDDELLDYARRNGSTCYHASCTCMMGSHAMASSTASCGCMASTGCG